jgi:hypothetical protein
VSAHGTWAAYNAGCRCDDCRSAARLYQKQRTLLAVRGIPRRVPSVGLRRRVQALACLGWDMYAIARELDAYPDKVRQWTLHPTVYRTTHEQLAAVYDRLSMRLPPTDTPEQKANVAKTRNRAARNGWLPPLAWDDETLDDPDARPARSRDERRRTDLDPVVVERVLAGERLPMTPAERAEVVRQARARGWSEAVIAQRTGIARGTDRKRYGERESA